MTEEALDPGTGNSTPGSTAEKEVESLKKLLADKEKLIAELTRDKETAEKARSGAMSAKDKLAEEYKKVEESLRASESAAKEALDEKAKFEQELILKRRESARLRTAITEGVGKWMEFLPDTDDEESLKLAAQKIKALAEEERKKAVQGLQNLEPPAPKPGPVMGSTLKELRDQLAKAKTPEEAELIRGRILEVAKATLQD